MLDIPPTNDKNEQEGGNEEDETDDEADDEGRSDGMPKAVQTSDAANKSNVPSTGNVAPLSSEELETLKWSKPIEYLKEIISARGSSNEKYSSFSTVSGGRSKSKSSENLLKKIKEKVFDVDLLKVMENDPSAFFGIKDLLKSVDILNTSSEVVDIIMDLGLLINQITADLHHVKDASTKIRSKIEAHMIEWEDATESTTRVAELETSSK